MEIPFDSESQQNESTSYNINLEKCRLCLMTDKANLLDFFSEEAREWNIVSKLNIHCSLIVTEDDDYLPRTICFSCLNEVSRFSDFYNRIQENQKLLLIKAPESLKEGPKEEFEVIKVASYDDEDKFSLASEDNSCENIVQDEYSNADEDCHTDEDYHTDGDCGTDTIEANNYTQSCPEESGECLSNMDQADLEIKNDSHEIPVQELPDSNDSSPVLCNTEGNTSKNNFKYSKSKEALKNLLKEYNAKSKNLILPSQKSSHRISLDEPIREFFDLNCTHCNSVFLTFITMKKHMQSHHNEKGFIMCCNKRLYRREAVMEHINYHLNPNKFTCHICKQICKSKVTLKVHLKQHIPEDQRPFRCDKCGQSFVLNSQLKSHEKSHLSEDEKKYVCEKCGKAFAFKFVLEKHKQHKHIRQKNYMCEICARSFVDKVNLTAHKRTHDDTLPRLQCPHCDALLKNKITLKIHMRTHNPETHSCSKCAKVLSTKNALMNHMQYVHGGKRFPCTVCQKVFKKSLTLKEHMTIHTGEILYNCQYCDKSFNAKANMYSHVKKVHTAEWAEQKRLKWGTVS